MLGLDAAGKTSILLRQTGEARGETMKDFVFFPSQSFYISV